MKTEYISLMKVLRHIKNKYFKNTKTYFDDDLKQLEKQFESEEE